MQPWATSLPDAIRAGSCCWNFTRQGRYLTSRDRDAGRAVTTGLIKSLPSGINLMRTHQQLSGPVFIGLAWFQAMALIVGVVLPAPVYPFVCQHCQRRVWRWRPVWSIHRRSSSSSSSSIVVICHTVGHRRRPTRHRIIVVVVAHRLHRRRHRRRPDRSRHHSRTSSSSSYVVRTSFVVVVVRCTRRTPVTHHPVTVTVTPAVAIAVVDASSYTLSSSYVVRRLSCLPVAIA